MSDSRWAIRIDKGDGSEMDYTAQEALEQIRPHYKDFEAIKEYFFAGHVVNTPFAYYRLKHNVYFQQDKQLNERERVRRLWRAMR